MGFFPTRMAGGVALAVLLCGAQAQGAPPEARQSRQVVRAHLELGQHKLRGGQFKQALGHFEAALARLQAPSELGAQASPGAPQRLARVKLRALMGAALSHWRLGQPERANRRGRQALDLARAHELKQGERQALRFLDDPAEATRQVAPTVQELEKWLQSLEGKP